MNKNIEAKIKALSLKTVANGASPSESAAAKEMISRLLGKKEETTKPQNDERSSAKEVTDDLARFTLQDDYYIEYLQRTHKFWELYNKTLLGIIEKHMNRLSREEYEKKCSQIYDELMKEMKEDEQHYRRKTKN